MQKKILVLVSNPKDMSNLNLLPEIRDLQEALQRSQHRERFAVEWRVAKHQTDLRRYILDIKPQIIHFCGHGTEQGLVLEDDTRMAKVVTNEVLTDLPIASSVFCSMPVTQKTSLTALYSTSTMSLA